MVLTVHDSIVFDHEKNKNIRDEIIGVVTEETAYWTKFCKQYWLKCPMKMDFESGPHWGDLREYEKSEIKAIMDLR